MIHQGLTHTSTLKVTNADTALEMGSGDMPVLATPAMTALMENAAMLAVSDSLPEGCTTVGGHISTSHLKPSRVGAQVSATATLDKIDGRKLYFTVKAHDGDTLIGEGSHLRFIVERDRFMAKL
ncbi:MAG: thioesterase family protein [Bacteroidales bacterium]|jgi:predicted thioesterase|uniref:thioesterase family protein n=1 Tax=Sodaliphilus pleomorphus TaxID=2606626 RepID=UPI0024093B02|nr:thioesterase family protein [Sodaliphilus pleomorphus]MCI5980119.1 thioesterase family protein [Muribaculaceae bacterium]MDD6687641.1 thioesterase family protein [Sodaliphilus pleomorphus]MDY6253229.1 thioesterase family protein [Bacteroidales bacterium]